MRTNQGLRRHRRNNEDSVYLYSPENKQLYQDVIESFSQSDCIFSRNLVAYLEDDHGKDSFYTKHLLSCETCQSKAKEYRAMLSKVSDSIPVYEMTEELFSMMRGEIGDVADLLNREEEDPHRIDFKATFKSSLFEFAKGFFVSREIVVGFILSCVVVLFTLAYR